MLLSTLLLYLVACFAVTVTPGPTMLLALSNGTTRNLRIVYMGLLGAALSDLLLIGAVSIGLGAILAASEVVFSVVKWIGVVYLAWIAWQMWRSAPVAPVVADVPVASSGGKSFARSLLVALSNPKGLLFFSAFLPQFIDTSQPQFPQYALLALLTAVLDIAIMACYAFSGAQAARLLTAKGLRYLNRVCAAVLLSLASFLAIYRRAD